MKIVIASDHRGLKYKKKILKDLKKMKYNIFDYGINSKKNIDYPDIFYPAIKNVQKKKFDKAIIICKTGVGAMIVANKIKGIRCVLTINEKIAYLSRTHNDTNVLAIPAIIKNYKIILKIIKIWLITEFKYIKRHVKRLKKIENIELIEKYIKIKKIGE